MTLEDIQKLKVKELRDILKCNSERAGGTKADLVLKVNALLVRNVVRSAENVEENAYNRCSGHVEYEETLVRISALGWSMDLRQLPELNFIQLYDYLVLSLYHFFLFHDIKSKCLEEPDPKEKEEPEGVPFSDNYGIASKHFKCMVDEHVSILTITQEEIQETERLTCGQNKISLWFEKKENSLNSFKFWKSCQDQSGAFK